MQIGDKVKIKSKGWYDANKDRHGYVQRNDKIIRFCPEDAEFCGKELTVSEIDPDINQMSFKTEESGYTWWQEWMIE